MVKIEERMRLLIILKIQDGDSQRKVFSDFNVCVSAVRKIWNKFQVTSSIIDKNRTGRPKKCSVKDQRQLHRQAQKQSCASAHELGIQLNLLSIVCKRTIRRYLHNSGLYAQVNARKPLLTKSQVKQRLACCKVYSAFGTADFNQIVFSDEAKIVTFFNTRRYVWRPKNSR